MEQWWTFPGVGTLSKIPQKHINDVSRRSNEPRTTWKGLQPWVASVKAIFHDLTIRKNGMYGRISRYKPLLTKRTQRFVSCLPEFWKVWVSLHQHFIKENHTNSQTCLSCFRTWITFCNWGNHKFCSLPENLEGECSAINSCTEAQAHKNQTKNKMKVLGWNCLDLNPIEMRWHDLRQAVHARKWLT